MPKAKIFQDTPIKEINWLELKGANVFFNSITEEVPFNLLDELLIDFKNDLARYYDYKFQTSGLCASDLNAEMMGKMISENANSRKIVLINEGVL